MAIGDPQRDAVLGVINNWRSCHGYPLLAVRMSLAQRAEKVSHGSALIAQRIKRLKSIALKLQQNPQMHLSQMQDIGGCRAVLGSVADVRKLVEKYVKTTGKIQNGRTVLVKAVDYIAHPKNDGYRSMHLIVKYYSRKLEYNVYDGQKIEIQVRSKLQHAWATAVETCQTFTGQALKTRIKEASNNWLRFFALMSSAIAAREGAPIVPGTPSDEAERRSEIRTIVEQENIIDLLSGWSVALDHGAVDDDDAEAFLLELNTAKRTLAIVPFGKDDMMFADAEYQAREKQTENDPDVQVVLVTADSLANLKSAYPNYYMDTTVFIDLVKHEVAQDDSPL